jgi:TRAP-type C4-dicarboxylate transport system substrate-binding protein
VVDIVWTVAGSTPGRFPRLEVFELPFLSHAIGEKTAPAVWEFYETFAKDELKDVKPLAVWGFGKGILFTKDVVIKTPADAKGLKLRASNRQTNDAFALIGAQPQSIPPPGVPEALAKGVVDGVVFPYDAVIPFKLDELTNRVSEFGGDRTFYNSVLLFVMNKAKYDALPDDLKTVIDQNSGAALSRDLGRKWDEWDQIGRAAVLKRNTPIHVIDGADLAAWKKATEPIFAKWIEERDKAGDKGADLVKAAQTLVVKYSQ